jgi:putative PIG3 family NAD(P)H quinone oxidoreductase
MNAVVLESYGGPEVLTLREVPDPVPAPDEVLVAVAGTALNRADLLQRMGLYPDPGPPAVHEIPGMEFAGRVVEVGARVRSVAVGDEVMGIVSGGAYAERLVTHERQVLAVPATVALADAAAIPEVWITAWDALVRQGGLRPGGTALVHAGASGVGTASIQIAKAIGATVAVTTSTAKVDACQDLGADLVVDYTVDDFVEGVRTLTGGRGVDVVLDVIGGDYLDRNIDASAPGGCIVQVGVMGAGLSTFALGKLLPKRLTIRGTVLRPRPVEEKIAVTQQFGREVVPWFDRGQARPVIDSRFPLSAIAEAHEHMGANANVGKIVIDVA